MVSNTGTSSLAATPSRAERSRVILRHSTDPVQGFIVAALDGLALHLAGTPLGRPRRIYLPSSKHILPMPSHFPSQYLTVWDEFLHLLGPGVKMPSFPIWTMESVRTIPSKHVALLRTIAVTLRAFARLRRAPLGKTAAKRFRPMLAPPNRSPAGRSDSSGRTALSLRSIPPASAGGSQRSDSLRRVSFEWNWQAGSRTVWDKVVLPCIWNSHQAP